MRKLLLSCSVVFFFLLRSRTTCSLAYQDDAVKSSGSLYGFALCGNAIISWMGQSMFECIKLCIDHQHCQSINFDLNQNICELLDDYDYDGKQVVPASEKIHWRNLFHPCFEQHTLCKNGGKCKRSRENPSNISCTCVRNWKGSDCTVAGLCEGENNIAKAKSATLSSEYYNTGYSASQAVDGTTDYCARTGYTYDGWLQIDLGSTYKVDRISLYSGVAKYLNSFELRVGMNDRDSKGYKTNPICGGTAGNMLDNQWYTKTCDPPLSGRYVFVRRHGRVGTYTYICEVAVCGQ